MAYMKRDQAGNVIAVSVEPVGEDWEVLADDHPELAGFAARLTQSQHDLAASDLALARVLEDLIDLLVERSVIRFTDLPEAAQAKLSQRRSTRASLHGLRLLDTDHDVI